MKRARQLAARNPWRGRTTIRTKWRYTQRQLPVVLWYGSAPGVLQAEHNPEREAQILALLGRRIANARAAFAAQVLPELARVEGTDLPQWMEP